MSRKTTGDYVHVVGNLDPDECTGTIDFVTPVSTAYPDQTEAGADGPTVSLIGEAADGSPLFEQPVALQRNSCQPDVTLGTYEAYVEAAPALSRLKLKLSGRVVAAYEAQPAAPTAAAAGFGPEATFDAASHRMRLAPGQATAGPGTSYTVQARPSGDSRWQTVALGLHEPQADVDVNQFPGADEVEVRVLETRGFRESEVLRTKVTPE